MDVFPSTSYGGYFSAGAPMHPEPSQTLDGTVDQFYAPPPPDAAPPGPPPPPPPAEVPPPPPEIAPPPLSPRSARKERARRTVSVQDVPPTVGTEEVLSSAFAQFGKVEDVFIVRSYLDSSRTPECLGTALVRFATEEQARKVIQETTEKLYMVGGMPRPIIACIADEQQLELDEGENDGEPEALPVRMLDRTSDKLEVEFAAKWRELHRKQQEERAALKKRHLKRESELAEKQKKVFEEIYEKYEIVRRTNHSQGVEQLKRVLSMRR